MANSRHLLKMSYVRAASASSGARGTASASARKRRSRLRESAKNCGAIETPAGARSSQYRSTIPFKFSCGATAFAAGEGGGAGALPQAASPKKASASELSGEKRVIQ